MVGVFAWAGWYCGLCVVGHIDGMVIGYVSVEDTFGDLVVVRE